MNVTELPAVLLSVDDFIERLLDSPDLMLSEAKTMWLGDTGRLEFQEPVPVKITVSVYGGGRMDRIRQRNWITNALGFPLCIGKQFMSANTADKGTFLANILADYGKEYWFVLNGVRLDFWHDLEYQGSYMGILPRHKPANAVPVCSD